MTCDELDKVLDPWLDGELLAEARVELEQHLATCPACTARADTERHRHDRLRDLMQAGSPPAPAALRDRLRQGIRLEETRSRRNAQLARAALAAGVMAVAAAGWQTWKGFRMRLYVDDVAVRHARGFPLEIERASPQQLQAWFGGKLDHRVTVPSFPDTVAAGARLSNVREKQAAYIRYDATRPDGSVPRMGLFVYADPPGDVDAPALPDVALTSSHGYRVVSARDGDLVYTLVTDTTDADIDTLRALLTREVGQPRVQPASLQR